MSHIETLRDLAAKLPESLPEFNSALSKAHECKKNRDFISVVCLLETVIVNVKQNKTTLTPAQIEMIQNCFELGYEITSADVMVLSSKLTKAGLHTLPQIDFSQWNEDE